MDWFGPSTLLLADLALTLLAVAGAFLWPTCGHRGLHALERTGARLARRPMLCLAVVAVGGVLLRVALLPLLPVPLPTAHDEYGYLLQAKTFASGRMSNPAHPLWTFFEAPHLIQQPSYTAKYPPGQGFFLFLGQWAGHPWLGVLLGLMLMYASLNWMLRGWLPPGWALLGTVCLVARVGLFSYWSNSYWGGALAAAGGALVTGALPRLWRAPSRYASLAMAGGIALLAATRMYEGAILSLVALAYLTVRLTRRHLWTRFLRHAAAPAAGVLLLLMLALGAYNGHVTGSPVRLPYQLHNEQYISTPLFIFQEAKAVRSYRHLDLQLLHGAWERRWYDQRKFHEPWGVQFFTLGFSALFFFLGPPLFFAYLGLPAMLQSDRRLRPAFVLLAAFVAALYVETFYFPHYAAPALGLLYLIAMQGMRRLRLYRHNGRPVGIALVRGLVMAQVLILLPAGLIQANQNTYRWSVSSPPAWCCVVPVAAGQAQFLPALTAGSGRHLVFVRFTAQHNPNESWIYNEPDIDHAQVVWAHDQGESENQKLMAHLPGRRIWLVEADQAPVRLQPYPPGATLALQH